MIRALTLAALVLPSSALAAPGLFVTGSCPGPADLELSGLTPGGSFALMRASGEGAALMPGGPCMGEPLGLRSAGLTLITIKNADASGNFTTTPIIPAPACGAIWMQAMDMTTCEVTNTWLLGSTGPAEGSFIPDWIPFPFIDNGHKDGCAGGTQYIKSSSDPTSPDLYVGATLCSSTEYKLWLSDTIYGTFHGMGDTCGGGEDHCQHVDGADGVSNYVIADESAFEGWERCTAGTKPSLKFFATNAWTGDTYECGTIP